ncbi:MAG: ABC transporter permease [Chloroflexi bacterium AL-N10]|nr:ABC transporter permease [Chloroflexi bacterium AL-N1]NOK66711.1 ABC transporter permease [Chloroflexi bacterium AL-N10]NOK72099.1 ABC transporter permease [Chloroflexi bacterium AL-N5]
MSVATTQRSKTQYTRSESLVAITWRRFTHHPMALAGAIILCAIIIIIAAAPITARYSPTDQQLRERFQAPSLTHWMGTDELGRDMWA